MVEVRSEYSRTGVRRSGDDYQDIVALEVLIEMLEDPHRYEWVKLEADEAGALDDVVAMRRDGTIVAIQVKFSAHASEATDPYSWTQLLEEPKSRVGKTLPSLLAKWAQGFRELAASYAKVDARLVSNRRPAEDLQKTLLPNQLIDLDRISDSSVKQEIFRQVGSESEARVFFGAFRIDLAVPGLDTFEDGLRRRFKRLGGDDHGWKNLKDEVRSWVRNRNIPLPAGRITLSDTRRAALWQELRSLPEEFIVPPDFVIPSDGFHADLLRAIREKSGACLVVCASPGSGKSTYLSYLYRELRAEGILAIRHHFFLSIDDPTPLRSDHKRVAQALMSELRTLPNLESCLPTKNPQPEDLGDWLSICGRQLAADRKMLVIILDGLDHVWKDTESVNELDRLFELVGPERPGVLVILGTQPVDRSQLPKRLSTIAPRETWRQLPMLDLPAVRKWTYLHAEEFRVPPQEPARSARIEDLAVAFWTKSEGHPLYLRYMAHQLKEQDSLVAARDIEALPEIPHSDINLYYSRLWEALPGLPDFPLKVATLGNSLYAAPFRLASIG
jgi:AAA ATPase-like protein